MLNQQAGLKGSSLVVPLLGFNLGVELGQLAVVVMALALLNLLREREYSQKLFQSVAAILIVVGVVLAATRL